MVSEEDPEQGLGLFCQSGFTRSDRNQIAHYFGGGLSYTGLIHERDSDILSLGAAVARNGHDFRDANPEALTTEIALELTYKMEILPYLTVQPDIQYIFNPGTDPELENAWVLGLRTEINM